MSKINNPLHEQKPVTFNATLPSNTTSFFKSILENSLISCIFILDENGTILDLNSGATKILGYTLDDVLGKNFSMLFTLEDQNKKLPEKEISKVISNGSASDNNYIVHKNGEQLWVQGESILVKGEEKKIFILKIIQNLDKQHELEKSLHSTNKDLKTFVYAASHDLKSPVNNIEGLIDHLEEILKDGKNYEETIDLLKVSIHRLKRTIDDLAEVGKQQEYAEQEAITKIEFLEILNEVKFNLTQLIERTNANIQHDFSEAPSIYFSRKNLRSVMQNLLSNAIKFRTPDKTPEISLKTKIEEPYVVFSIKDNGIGINESQREKIFSMYSRQNEHIEGTGVGLAIVSRIVNNNDGKIIIDTNENSGTTFHIYLKMKDIK